MSGSGDKARCDDSNRKYPEVETVVSQLGRPDDGTDVSGFYNVEFFAPLKRFDEWPRGMTKEKLTDQISGELRTAFPGVVFNEERSLRRSGSHVRCRNAATAPARLT